MSGIPSSSRRSSRRSSTRRSRRSASARGRRALVPVLSGLLAVIALMVGLSRRWPAERAASSAARCSRPTTSSSCGTARRCMESTMTAFIVAAWMAWVLARSARAIVGHRRGRGGGRSRSSRRPRPRSSSRRSSLEAACSRRWTAGARTTRRTSRGASARPPAPLAGLVGRLRPSSALLFVLPHWTDYQFYNWQMTVTRKPSYAVGAFVDRATWLPIVQDVFSRMWSSARAASSA